MWQVAGAWESIGGPVTAFWVGRFVGVKVRPFT